jgi:carbamoyltransferase
MNILGISPNHDSSVCLLSDGQIKYFSKEERLSRVKRASDPNLATEEALKLGPIDYVVWCPPTQNPKYRDEFIGDYFKSVDVTVNDLSDYHHLTHASLGFYNSGFTEAAIIVVDRNGSIMGNSCRESETIFMASYPATFDQVYKSFWIYNNIAHQEALLFKEGNPKCEVDVRSMYGVVKVYETATALIKQHALENGKIMGLSAYGNKDAEFYPLFFKGNIPNDYYLGHEETSNRISTHQDLQPFATDVVTPENFQMYADYAWQVQKQTQDAVCYLIQKAIDKTGLKNIVITGGYGMNVVANHYYLTKFPEVKFFFEPLADDSGNSIGGAMFIHRLLTGDTSVNPLNTTFFSGKYYSLKSIHGLPTQTKDVAKLLANGKSVAVYRGLAEAGPRALGNRSILFDPRNKDAKEIVNKIKKREWYRPFAAMVLEEDAHMYFEMGGVTSSPYMTISFPAKQYAIDNIPGVIHVDNTCRLQTVSKSDGYLYELLLEFKALTGHGVILNTSFNLAGEPLIETPEEAIKTLRNSTLNHVWFEEKNVLI